MRKILLFLAALILISGFAFAQENVIPVKIVEFPLPSSARTYEISEYRSFVEMDRPFMGDGFSCRFAPFTSADISDYSYDTEGEAIVFKRVENVEKTESIGTVFFTDVNGSYYVLIGNAGGEINPYYENTKYIVANPALKLSKEYTIDKDGVLIRNDSLEQGLIPLLTKYGVLLVENDITIRNVTISTRMMNIISATDDNTLQSANDYIDKIIKGELSVVGESAFFDGIKVHNSSFNTNYIREFIELQQYLKASLFNELGLQSNYNMKKAYINTTEVSISDDILLPFCDDMLKQRKQAVEKINDMFGLDISVDYDSSWKINESEQEKQYELNADAIENGVSGVGESNEEIESAETKSENTKDIESEKVVDFSDKEDQKEGENDDSKKGRKET